MRLVVRFPNFREVFLISGNQKNEGGKKLGYSTFRT